MTTTLIRTGSVPVLTAALSSSSFSKYRPLHGVFTAPKNSVPSPKISMHFVGNNSGGIRRVSSESDITRSLHKVSSSYAQAGGVKSRSRNLPPRIPEEGFNSNQDDSTVSNEDSGFGCGYCGECVADMFSEESSKRSKIGAYYEAMLKLNPSDALLLRNYGKFLHEVEKDAVRAEECYSRAILATPGDGELLALYGKLVWETEKDKERAQYYFDRAVFANPNDCLVIGCYAHFLWQVEEDEEEEEEEVKAAAPALVSAF